MRSELSTDDRVRVVVNGAAYRNWYEVDIDSDVFTPADAWSVKARVPDRAFVTAFREGMSADVYVGDDRQLAGLIDEVQIAVTRQRALFSLQGRDKGGYLIDCEAPSIKASKYTLKTFTEKLLKPEWGISKVILSNEDNRKKLLGKRDRATNAGLSRRGGNPFTDDPRTSVKVDPGQKVAAIIEQNCRRVGITWWFTAGGELYLGKPNYSQEPAFSFKLYAPSSAAARENNVLEATIFRSLSERYSKITIAGQGSSNQNPFTSGGKDARFKASADDADLVARKITRELILTDSDTQTRKEAQRRADLEQGLRRMRGLTLHVKVAGFRQAGRLFTIDTLANVKIEEAGIDGIFWVAQRRFVESKKSRRTELTLYQPGIYLP